MARLREIINLLTDTGRGLLNIAIITGLGGIIIGVLALTSLDFSLTFIVPFMFALSPSLLFIGPWESAAPTIFTALIATFLLGVGLVGYLFRPIGALRWTLFIAVMCWLIDGFGLMAAIALVTAERTSRSK